MDKWPDAPTGAGWWLRWQRFGKAWLPSLVQLEESERLGLKMVGGNVSVAIMDQYKWYGPIPEPPEDPNA